MARTNGEEKSISSSQVLFLNTVKQMLPPSQSLVNVLSELLNISTDGAYRRIRGETSFTLDEIIEVCSHFHISFDSFCNNNTGTVAFSCKLLTSDEAKFDQYLDGILSDMTKIASFDKKHVIYSAEDPPVFHYFIYPALTAFKLFYWKKAIINAPSLEGVKFSSGIIDPVQIETARKISELYVQIPSVEIWSEDTIVGSVRQIQFFYESGFFASKEDALQVCEDLLLMLKALQKQAELSTKFHTESDKAKYEGNFTLYQSEVMIGNNSIYITMGDLKAVYLTYNTVNSMITTNAAFCAETEAWLKTLMRKSLTISGVGEKQRYTFFRSMQDRVQTLITRIKDGN